jgi:imidazolonepropionase-like amidohydrolase
LKSLAFILVVALAAPAAAQTPPPAITVFQNVRIFDGKSSELSPPASVLVHGNKIERISSTAIPADQMPGAVLIDGGGRTLMPGLIDMHWHAMLVRPTPAAALAADIGYLNLVASAEATDTLLRGFTTVRDLGGPTFGLKRAIDEGIVALSAGAVITVTGGHGDFRQLYELPGSSADRRPDRRSAQDGRRQSRRGSPRA